MTWMLNQPQIYEASIRKRQFFLIGELFCFHSLDKPAPSNWRWVLTGIFWGAAVGSRNVLALPLLFMTLMIVLWLVRSRMNRRPIPGSIVFTGAPFPIGHQAQSCWDGITGLVFGSVLETGLRFSLAD